MKKQIYSCMWLNQQSREAADFYCSIFKDSKIISDNPLVTIFEINGTQFMGLNGGPDFKANEAVSFVVECESQEEIDHYWYSLTREGGEESMCGWVKDKYGFSWQIIPHNIHELIAKPNAMSAMLKMRKLDIATLESA